MAADARIVSPSPLHDLRGQLNTVRLSAHLLEYETDLTQPGRSALLRLQRAVAEIERELESIEWPTEGGRPSSI